MKHALALVAALALIGLSTPAQAMEKVTQISVNVFTNNTTPTDGFVYYIFNNDTGFRTSFGSVNGGVVNVPVDPGTYQVFAFIGEFFTGTPSPNIATQNPLGRLVTVGQDETAATRFDFYTNRLPFFFTFPLSQNDFPVRDAIFASLALLSLIGLGGAGLVLSRYSA